MHRLEAAVANPDAAVFSINDVADVLGRGRHAWPSFLGAEKLGRVGN
jgi:hypothetical protein